MKNNEEKISITTAIKELRKELHWPELPEPPIRFAINHGKIPHYRTSEGTRSRIFVTLSDVRKYVESLKH